VTYLRCNDYGHDCGYVAEGEMEKVVDEFWKHIYEEHGIDYAKGTILGLIKKRKLRSEQTFQKISISIN